MVDLETETAHQGNDQMIHLYAPNAESSEAVIPIRWCVCKTTLEQLRADSVKSPHLLLVVVKRSELQNREVERHLIPLDRAMQYVQFSSPGNHTILASIVWEKDGNSRIVRQAILGRDDFGDYKEPVFATTTKNDETGVEILVHPALKSLGQATLDINVSREFFAKEPPQWLSRWVNFMGWPQARDQCQFRRRCIFAFTAQPVIVFAVFAIYFIGAICTSAYRCMVTAFWLSLGKRNLNLKPILHPFSRDVRADDIYRHCSASVFTQDNEGNPHPLYLQVLTPFYWIVFFLIAVLVARISYGREFSAKTSFCYAILWTITASSLVVLFFAICRFLKDFALTPLKRRFRRIGEAIDQKLEIQIKKSRERYMKNIQIREKEAAGQLVLFYDSLEPITCTGTPPPVDLEALPKNHQTISLRFARLKAMVCKPFAR